MRRLNSSLRDDTEQGCPPPPRRARDGVSKQQTRSRLTWNPAGPGGLAGSWQNQWFLAPVTFRRGHRPQDTEVSVLSAAVPLRLGTDALCTVRPLLGVQVGPLPCPTRESCGTGLHNTCERPGHNIAEVGACDLVAAAVALREVVGSLLRTRGSGPAALVTSQSGAARGHRVGPELEPTPEGGATREREGTPWHLGGPDAAKGAAPLGAKAHRAVGFCGSCGRPSGPARASCMGCRPMEVGSCHAGRPPISTRQPLGTRVPCASYSAPPFPW